MVAANIVQISKYLLARQYVWWREVIHFIGEERRVQISRSALQHNILPSQSFRQYSKNICQLFKYSNFMGWPAPQNYTSHKIWRPQNTLRHFVFKIQIVEINPILDNDIIIWGVHNICHEIFACLKNLIWSSELSLNFEGNLHRSAVVAAQECRGSTIWI